MIDANAEFILAVQHHRRGPHPHLREPQQEQNSSPLQLGKVATSCIIHRFQMFILDRSNKITRDGAAKLSIMLKMNRTLQGLDLSCNRIEDPGAVYLADVLHTKQNTSLKLYGCLVDAVSTLKTLMLQSQYVQQQHWSERHHRHCRRSQRVLCYRV